MKKPIIVQQFGDVANDQGGRGPEYGFYDNGSWQNVLDISHTPNHGPSNPDGLKEAEAHALWLRDHKVDIVIWTLWFLGPAIKRVKAMCPDLKVIGLTDHPLNIDIAMSPIGHSANYIHKIEGADALMVLTPRERQFYGGLHENTHYVGLPFPHKSYERWRVDGDKAPPSEKDVITVGLGVGGPGHSWHDRNYLTTALAFKQLQRYMAAQGKTVRGVWLSWSYSETQPHQKMLTQFAQGVDGTEIQYRSEMQTFLSTLQSCDFVISNITRDTPGRLVAECAWAGVPLIGSDSLSLQGECFPDFTVDAFDISTMVTDAILLCGMTGEDRGKIIAHARTQMRDWGYDRSRERFCKVLESIGYDPAHGWETV